MQGSTSISSLPATSTWTSATRWRTFVAALGDAPCAGSRGTGGVARYGSAVVPMDESRALAAVDLVRRPHAEISLAFTGDRVGGLAPLAAPARARAVRDGGGPAPCTSTRAESTTTMSPRRPSRRWGRRCARRSQPETGASAQRRGPRDTRSRRAVSDTGRRRGVIPHRHGAERSAARCQNTDSHVKGISQSPSRRSLHSGYALPGAMERTRGIAGETLEGSSPQRCPTPIVRAASGAA